jgi:hypothetical protein
MFARRAGIGAIVTFPRQYQNQLTRAAALERLMSENFSNPADDFGFVWPVAQVAFSHSRI